MIHLLAHRVHCLDFLKRNVEVPSKEHLSRVRCSAVVMGVKIFLTFFRFQFTFVQYWLTSFHFRLVEVLLQNGADPNLEGPKYPIWEALSHPKCLQLLLKYGADTNLTQGSLKPAVARRWNGSAMILLDHGVHPDEKMNDHWSPLTSAIRENKPDLVSLLLSQGADVNMKGENWPLVCAVGRPAIMKILFDAGADWKKSPEVLEVAAWQNDIESVKLFLAAGMPADTVNPNCGFYPLGTAI